MRFHRLRLANYRGIGNSEVKFSPLGITVVQGPNEVGKTSIGEAISFLFEYPDSSKHRNVEAIRPVHKDEGPEIELEAESGPYTLTYFKRFYKRPETRLTITQPRPENYTGREAHERAEIILHETLDVNLWKALTVHQGDAINLPSLSRQNSLSAALDQAAGGRSTDPRQEGLFEKARNEYNRCFTARGTERKELQEARKVQTEIQAEITHIEEQIHGLEKDIERAATLQRELEQLKKLEKEQEEKVTELTTSLEEVNTLESALTEARLKLESAQKSEQAARREKEVRQNLIDEVAKTTKAHKVLQESSSISLAGLNQAEEGLKKAQTIFNKAELGRKQAEKIVALRRADFDYYNNKLFLEQFRERKDRIDQARRNAAQAGVVLARNKVDSRALKTIQENEQELLIAKAQLVTGAPNVILQGLADCKIHIDGEVTTLGKDEIKKLSVTGQTRLTVPDILHIEITAGSSSEGLGIKVSEAQRAIEVVCNAAGVDSPDEARIAFDERREALRQIENKSQVEEDNLRDLTYEQLDEKLIELENSVPNYLSQRASDPAISDNLDSAKEKLTNAEKVQEKASEEWEAAHAELNAARKIRDELSAKYQEVRVQVDMLVKEISHVSENLERARKSVSDDALDANLSEAVRAVSAEESKVQSTEKSLHEKHPEKVRTLAEAAKGSLQTTQHRRTQMQTQQTEVQTRLRVLGEEGFHEKLHAAQSRSEHIESGNRALFRRAIASKLLFETMRSERDDARRAYVAPLKEKIEHLGRLVFNETFKVEINEELQIVNRTTNGVTVPFDSLSGGTKEQLSLIFRLACSMIVTQDGGAPLILDDTLGYTDPGRLQLMGAVLAKAAKECQIIIFTCVPDRYANVGEATFVSLG